MAKSFAERGYKVTVVCPLPNYPHGRIFSGYRFRLWKTEIIGEIKVVRLWTYPSISKKALPRLFSMLSFSFILFLRLLFFFFKKPTIAIVQSPPLMVSFTGVLALSKILNIKTYLNVSDLWPKSAVELGVVKEGKFLNALLYLEQFIYDNSNAFICQSEEIKKHIFGFSEKPKFVYRNVPSINFEIIEKNTNYTTRKVVYAGLLGFAQGVLDIVKSINFNELELEFHIYGKGMQEHDISVFCSENKNSNVFFHGSFKASEAHIILRNYDASLVPLTHRIYGAVPSKIFELIHFNIPILFSGGGEGNDIVEKYSLGLTCRPGDYESMTLMLQKFKKLSNKEIQDIKSNLNTVKDKEFDYQNQFDNLIRFIENE